MSAEVIFTIFVILLNVIALSIIVTHLKFKSLLNVVLVNVPLILLSDYFKFGVAFGFLFAFYVLLI